MPATLFVSRHRSLCGDVVTMIRLRHGDMSVAQCMELQVPWR